MIKAVATDGDLQILVIGLSFANLKKFLDNPGDTFIRIKGKEIGLSVDVMIFSGETEQNCINTISFGIGPETKIHEMEKE